MRSEQRDELGVSQNRLRPPGAAHMPVEAHHGVGRGHHQVKIVRHQEDPATAPVADIGDEPVEIALAGEVHPGQRLVEHQEPGLAQQGPREQHALHLSAGDLGQRIAENRIGADLVEHPLERPARGRRAKRHEAFHRHRQNRIALHVLRHVADAQAWAPQHLAAIGFHDAQDHADQRRFAGAVEPDQGDDFPDADGDIHRVEYGPAAEAQADAARLDERRGLGRIVGGCIGHSGTCRGHALRGETCTGVSGPSKAPAPRSGVNPCRDSLSSRRPGRA